MNRHHTAPYRDTSVLVTGGAGFIGSYIVERLVSLGARVTVLDNFATGTHNNIAHLHGITVIEGSVTDIQTCTYAVEDCKYVFHLAGFVSVPDSMTNPTQCHATNVTGTVNILEACRHAYVKHVMLSSSSAVYGNLSGACTETSPCNPTSPYGLSKLIAENYCRLYSKAFGLKTTSLRYFNVYGSRQNPHGAYAAVVAKFTKQLKANAPIIVYGDGTQTRDFIPVAQVVDANLTLALDPNADGDVYNIATGRSVNLLELIEQLKQEYPDSTSTVSFEHARKGDILHSQADCTKYHTKLKSLSHRHTEQLTTSAYQ